MNTAEQFILQKLQQRTEQGTLRKLPAPVISTDFSSNDYLGFARSPELRKRTQDILAKIPEYQNGSGGSRLLSGNHHFTEETEHHIANFHSAEAGLIFNSGYDANLGLLSSLAQRGDTIIADELIHASLIDGARLSHANRYAFKHNDLGALEAKLKIAKGAIYVLAESVYSMDGDIAPLQEMSDLCKHYRANLIVDEAHALGIFGNHGKGLVQMLGLEQTVFARVITFGKALGCHGAIVLGSSNLRQYLINFARSFIYTTAAPVQSIAQIFAAYQMLASTDYAYLMQPKIMLYNSLIRQTSLRSDIQNTTAIHTILFQSNKAAKAASSTLQLKNFDVRAILSPTVPQGKERLRICLHLFNTNDEIKLLINELTNLKNE